MLKESQKELIIRVLIALFPESTIYLFGSRAGGTHQPGSDIDLAIDANKELPYQEIMQAKNVMAALNIPYMVDIVDMHHIPQDLKEEILTKGVVWKRPSNS